MMVTMLVHLTTSSLIFSASVTAGPVELVADGFRFTEGPVWVEGKGLLFSDIPADRIYVGDKTVFREPSGQSNGLILDVEGRLLAAEHANRRVTRTEADGEITVIAEQFEGKRFNSPNDLAVRSDGTIFFTDPPYGLPGGLEGPNADLDFSGVYRVKPDGEVVLLGRDFLKPNGIALSIDEKTLYVADTEGSHIRAFTVDEAGDLSGGEVFYELPTPDGMCLDVEGNIYCTARDGVHVISPSGEKLGLIETPQPPANCAFGGDDGKTLYITARTAVYRLEIGKAGYFVHESKGQNGDLPVADARLPQMDRKSLTIQLNVEEGGPEGDGRVLVVQEHEIEVASWDELTRILSQFEARASHMRAMNQEEPQITIQADQKVPIERLVRVLEIANSVGIEHLGILSNGHNEIHSQAKE